MYVLCLEYKLSSAISIFFFDTEKLIVLKHPKVPSQLIKENKILQENEIN